MLDKYLVWFKAHERLLIILAVLAVGIRGWDGWLDKSATDAKTQAAVAAQSAQAAKTAVDQQAALMAQQIAQFNQRETLLEQEKTSLVAALASRDAASSKRVTDVTAPKTPTQAIQDLSTTYTLSAPVTVTADGADVPTADLQQFTVAKIEGDTAKSDLVDTQKELADTTASLKNATDVIGGFQTQVSDLNVLNAKDAKQCDADKKVLKAEARKSKWHWFLTGLIAGFVGREAISH